MCRRTLTARRPRSSKPDEDDSTPGCHETPFCISLKGQVSPSSSQGLLPSVWPPWKLPVISLCIIVSVIILGIFPTSALGADALVPPSKPVRSTAYGKIQGHTREVLPGKFMEYYLGVPYAAPPIGDLRFANPEEPEPWNSTLLTDKHPPACMQKDKRYIKSHRIDFDTYDEDCLYLNIYVPQTTKRELLPVFAYIHGGSNIVGMAAMHDGDVFASFNDVIVVMMNYRLAAFGFFTLADPELPGNYGLMDQLHALKWIQKNIHFFGGDKNKVTVSGHSAGAGDVGLHALSSLAKGLFRYAICQSGSGTAPWVILPPEEDVLRPLKDYVTRLQCQKGTSLEIKKCLREKPAKLISTTWIEPPLTGYSFFAVDYKYLPDRPKNLFAHGTINAETMMMGITRNEGTVVGLYMNETFNSHDFIRMVKQNQQGFPRVPHIDDLIIHEYMQWENPNPGNNVSGKMSLSQLFGDYSLTYPIYQCMRLLAERKFPTYFYAFYHRSSEDKTPDWVGVPHGEDVFYLFGAPLVGHALRNYTELDKDVSKKLMTLFGNFVKTGKAFIGSQEFKHYTSDDKLIIKFHSENNTALVSHDTNLLTRRMDFWDTLIPSLTNKNSIDERARQDWEEEQVRKTFIFQVLTGIFVSLSLVLIMMLFLRMRTDSTQNKSGDTTETRTVVVDYKHDTSPHLVSKEVECRQTITELSPKNV